MADVPEISGESSAAAATTADDANSDESSEVNLQDMFSNFKLNPMADEFAPSWISSYDPFDFFSPILFSVFHTDASNGYPNNRRRRSKYNSQGRKKLNEKASKAQKQDRIKRTVYVSDIDHNVTEDRLAALFSTYGQVLDCRVCGDPHSRLRFAFVEFADEDSARSALNLSGIMLGFSQVMVLPSKTAILPVSPTFLPKSQDEKEMCARTIYCTNIDKKVSQDEVKNFFEERCGEVSRIGLLGDHVHSRIAFVEFMTVIFNSILVFSRSLVFLCAWPVFVAYPLLMLIGFVGIPVGFYGLVCLKITRWDDYYSYSELKVTLKTS